MLTAEEKQSLAKIKTLLTHEIQIRLVVTDDDRSSEFQKYCELLAELSPKIRIKKEREAGHRPPAIGIDSILLHALPQGTELPPFTELLLAKGNPVPVAENELPEANFEIPAMFKLYVSAACPFCPVMMKKLFPAASAYPALNLTVVDVALFSEMAKSDEIKSVPTLILDNTFRWTGSIDMDDLFKTVRHRDPAKLSMESLKSMIVNGDAFRLAEMMIREQKIFPAFFDLLTHEEFSIRLGAMAAAEELVDKNTDIALQLVNPLMDHFEAQIDQIKGDVLYILGQAGDRRIIPFLKHVAAGKYADDVKEAAVDAIEQINAR